MNRRGVSFVSCFFLLALLAAGDDVQGNNCKYTIKISTARKEGNDQSDPSTSDAVDVRFGDDTAGPGIIVRNISSKLVIKGEEEDSRAFKEGAADEFEVIDKCVTSKICLFFVRLNGADDWKPDAAKVEVEGHEDFSSTRFNYGRYVTINKWDGYQNECQANAQTSDYGESSIINLVFPVKTASTPS